MSKWQTYKDMHELHESPLFSCPKKYAIIFHLISMLTRLILSLSLYRTLSLFSSANLNLVSPAFAYAFRMRQSLSLSLISSYYISYDIRKRFLYRFPLSPRPRPVQILVFF